MIATNEPHSPHESTNKGSAPSATTASIDINERAPMGMTDPSPRSSKSGEESDASVGEVNTNDQLEESDLSEFDEDKHSEELKLLSLDSLDHDDLPTDSAPAATESSAAATTATAGIPVKRIVRRRRKRMSEEERRIRHREVQRQFMKRKRARLGEMRRFLRGLQSQHRLVQVMNERAVLEKENTALRVALATPGSGWQWDDTSTDHQSQAKNPPPDQPLEHHPGVVYGHLSPAHMHSAAVVGTHGLVIQQQHHHLDYQTPHMVHGIPQQHMVHGMAHRGMTSNGIPLPWDDILDAVSSSAPSGHFHDMSF